MKKGVVLFGAVLILGIVIAALITNKSDALSDVPASQPNRSQVVPVGTAIPDIVHTADEARVPELMQPTSTVVRATKVLLDLTCSHGTERCKLQAIYDFVRFNYEHVQNSPQHNYIQPAAETLYYGSGDSLELAILLSSMQRAAGFENEILIGPYHNFVRTELGEETIIADPACQGCQFMNSRVSLRGDEKTYS